MSGFRVGGSEVGSEGWTGLQGGKGGVLGRRGLVEGGVDTGVKG